MSSFTAPPQILVPGTPVLLRHRFSDLDGVRAHELWSVASNDPDGGLILQRAGEKPAIFQTNPPRDWNARHEIAWTHAMPDLPEKNLGQILEALSSSSWTRRFLAFRLNGTMDGMRLDPIGWNTSDGSAGPLVDPAILPKGMAAGDCLLLRPQSVRDGSDNVVVTEADIVPIRLSEDVFASVLDERIGPFGSRVWPVGDHDDFDCQIGHAQAKHEENMLLVLEVDSENGADHLVLHEQGSKLYWNDTTTDDLWGTSLGQGLWIGTGIAWYDNGDDGAEWSADWRPATKDDVLSLMTWEQLRAEAEDFMERTMDDKALGALFVDPEQENARAK